METIFWKEKNCFAFKKCPSWLKATYLKAVDYTCQGCGKKTKKLTPHRIIRGNKGGLYTVALLNSKSSNVKVVCYTCHKLYHANEFSKVRSK